MPFEQYPTTVETCISNELANTLKDIGDENGWPLNETYNHALLKFIECWREGETSRRYYGTYSHGKKITAHTHYAVKDDLFEMKDCDGVPVGMIIQEAFYWFAEHMGHPAPVIRRPINRRAHSQKIIGAMKR
ncbi:hypothetical protein [Pelagibius sp. Alg239-R121]|uniref:hypothetical protein n=1 Tax=Pelagibius sp. Alg239-R121 TaxID=2993448 RepID=UPI0024A73432|nr:hypothetical protein [Pelagibius sp. Alg239-R121]